MKEKILKVLMDSTHTESRYEGGGDEPSIIVFTHSENEQKEFWLENVAKQIETELSKK